MSSTWALRMLLLLSIAALANSQQFDLFQGIQQLFQTYQQNQQSQQIDPLKPNRHRKPDEITRTDRTKTKKPSNQQDYMFGTTSKPSRKTTIKRTHNQSKEVNHSTNKNLNTDHIPPTYESTTKLSRNKAITNARFNNDRVVTDSSNKVSFVTENPVGNEVNRQINTNLNSYDSLNTVRNYETPRPDYRLDHNDDYAKNQKDRGQTITDTRNVNVAHLTNDNADTIERDLNNRGANNFNRRTPNFATENPFVSGVLPADIIDGRAPLTNRPIRNDVFSTATSGSPFGSSEPELPQLLPGPDEDAMSPAQKRRYTDKVEDMCKKIKASLVRQIVPLPLLPNAKPNAFNVSSCRVTSTPLVINGKIVDIKDFPHMALLGWMKARTAGYLWKCGGSLISEEYVLTAAHCAYQESDSEVISGPPQAVQLGSTYLDDPGALVVKVEAVYRHPKYKTRTRYHDIALVKLKTKISSFSDVIRPACIGTPPSVNGNVVATGWGRTEIGGDNSFELRSASLAVWDLQQCRDIWGVTKKLPEGVTADSHLCAADKKGKSDTCQGDSGGPAQVQDNCVWRLVAVTSYGRSCALPNTPALYAVIPRAFIGAQLFPEPDVGDRGSFPDSGVITFRD